MSLGSPRVTCALRSLSNLESNEQHIVEAIKAGDRNAFEMIFRTWYKPLCNYAHSFLQDKDESEEVVQNTLVIVWEKRLQISVETSLRSYLFRSVRNSCLNAIKHRKVVREHEKYAVRNSPVAEAQTGQKIISSELEKRIAEAMLVLPEQCQLVFRMSRLEELKYSEIAEQLGISVKTVENHMGKALRIMREELKDYLPLIAIFIAGFLDN